jgi:PAS domain S-box-containing protein
MIFSSETSGLNNSESEPIHAPSSIQTHGILFVLEEPLLKIIQVSKNTFEAIGLHPQEILGKFLDQFITSETNESIKTALTEELDTLNPLVLYIHTESKNKILNGTIHRSNGLIIIELEPKISSEYQKHFNLYNLVEKSLNKIQKANTLRNLCDVIAQEIRKIIGFDRVIVYQFDAVDAGEVVAEDKIESLNPLLGLHYPSTDIPQLARHLATKNLIRFISDVNCQPVELIPHNNPLTNRPLDLSFSCLRSVSPCHVQYLKNMGVSASLTITLIKDKKLWGLIACHHQTPKYVSYEVRSACELLAKFMALELSFKKDSEDREYEVYLKSICAKFVEDLSQEHGFAEGLLKQKDNLLKLVGASGAVVCAKEKLTLIGKTPELVDIRELIAWVETQLNNDTFYTDSLARIYPKAEKFKEVASGLLVLAISQMQKHYILWFRPEVIQTVNWAGKLDSADELESGGIRSLSPRNSFELWEEIVRLKSLPWKQCEIEIALELRVTIVGIELRKINQQLTLALSATKMGFWDWDLPNNRITWSSEHEQLFGLAPGTFNESYECFAACIHPEDLKGIENTLNQARIDREDCCHEYRVIWPDGSIHWIQGRGKFFYSEEGEAVRMVGTVIGISDRKIAEKTLHKLNEQLENRVFQRTKELEFSQAELRQSEALFRSLSECSPVGIFRIDAEGKFIYTNPRCQAIGGFTSEEALGDGWMQFVHPEDLKIVLSLWSTPKEFAQEFSCEFRHIHRNGTVRFCRVKTAPIFSALGQLIGHVGTVADITESRAIEQMKNEFISIVSHELRTPLASIRGSLGLLAAGVLKNQPETAKQMLEIASNNTERLVRLVNDILDLERLDSTQVTLAKQWCDGADLIRQSVKIVQSLVDESNINLSILSGSAQSWAEPDRIIQMLVNLLSNAIKFSPAESTVTVSVEDLGDSLRDSYASRVLFAVKDQGRGIPADKLENIFGRFQQVDASDSRQKGGTGLGLAICRSIVQQHGGRIWVESVVGEGSSFYFTLPAPFEGD